MAVSKGFGTDAVVGEAAPDVDATTGVPPLTVGVTASVAPVLGVPPVLGRAPVLGVPPVAPPEMSGVDDAIVGEPELILGEGKLVVGLGLPEDGKPVPGPPVEAPGPDVGGEPVGRLPVKPGRDAGNPDDGSPDGAEILPVVVEPLGTPDPIVGEGRPPVRAPVVLGMTGRGEAIVGEGRPPERAPVRVGMTGRGEEEIGVGVDGTGVPVDGSDTCAAWMSDCNLVIIVVNLVRAWAPRLLLSPCTMIATRRSSARAARRSRTGWFTYASMRRPSASRLAS